MSKAFTKEDDTGDAFVPKLVSVLPPGARNYLTARGAKRLQLELAQLRDGERPALMATTAEAGMRGADAKERLQHVEQRVAQLEQALRSAEITVVPPEPHDVVRFGATVEVRDPRGKQETYRIVGVDETDFERNEVSWLSPIARALLNAKLGQRVAFKFPSGAAQLEIVSISYETDAV
ncbi:GreA/GreB family elongation factor [Oleiharenicola lentus]|uniref:GreA/GreB family elongation factor n=1 Tax=Oleiharenicola lentus TaxID=2508720 RepID=UPI003F675289